MNLCAQWLQSPAAETLAYSLLHTLWQAALAATLLAITLCRLPGGSSQARYRVAVACLAGVLLSGLTTWSILHYESRVVGEVSSGLSNSIANEMPPAAQENISATATTNLGYRGPASTTGTAFFQPTTVLLLAWMAGATAFLLRAGRSVAVARRLAQGPLCDDPRLLSTMEEVRRLLGVARRVPMVVNDCLQSPVVVGVLQPTLVLPTSLMIGLTPDDLRALFAHELAHIRRHDYLVNLMQLLVESLLFFNPAVWWISRQIRVEREACCDQLAVGLTGQPVRYAQLLADWAGRMRVAPSNASSRAAMALADSNRHSLLDRIRRILSPGERPVVRLSWATCIGFLLLSLTGLVLLQRGADLTVLLAAQLLTDDQRVAVVTEAADQYGVGAGPKENLTRPTISGRVVTEDGQPHEGKIQGSINTRKGNSSSSSAIRLTAPEFRVTADPGVSWLQVYAPGYAPVIVGPFDSSRADHFDQVEVVLRPGVSAIVRVVDEYGQGVASAKVSFILTNPKTSGGTGYLSPQETDEDGYVHLEHLNPDFPHQFYVAAAGFQKLEATLVPFEKTDGLELTLSVAQPVSGEVVDQQGEPIAGANLKIFRQWQVGHMSDKGRFSEVLATTGDNGRFTLGQLSDGFVYDLLIEASGYGSTILADVKPGSSDWRVPMSPALTIRGRILGTVEQLATLSEKGLLCEQQFPSLHPQGTIIRLQENTQLQEVDGEQRFQVDGLAPVKTLFKTSGQITVYEKTLTESLDGVVISLQDDSPFETRQVVVRFAKEGQLVKPRGQMKVAAYRVGAISSTNETYPLVDGELRFESAAPGILNTNSEGMLGYWISTFFQWPKVTSGEGPLEIEVPVYSAGAVQGKVLEMDGQPARRCGVSVFCKLEIPAAKSANGQHHSTSFGINTTTDADGRFFITPVPLGARCLVSFGSNHYRQVLSPFSLDDSQPTQTLALQLGEVATATGVLLLSDGLPAAGLTVGLEYHHPEAGMSWSPPQITNHRGQFSFEGLRRGATEYVAEYKSTRDFLPTSTPLSTEGASVTLQLETGLVLEGVAIDQTTDRPVPGVRVYALPVDWNAQSGGHHVYEAEGLTDAEGRFRFSNLPNRTMALGATEMWLKQTIEVDPGGKPIILRAEVADWYREKIATVD